MPVAVAATLREQTAVASRGCHIYIIKREVVSVQLYEILKRMKSALKSFSKCTETKFQKTHSAFNYLAFPCATFAVFCKNKFKIKFFTKLMLLKKMLFFCKTGNTNPQQPLRKKN